MVCLMAAPHSHMATSTSHAGCGRHIWLVSDGRSGSTWLSALINHAQMFAEYFEPLHSDYTPSLQGDPLIPYIRPGHVPDRYRDLYRRVFRREFVGPRSGPRDKNRSSVLVKDIHALLSVRAISEEHPDVGIVCLIRDPVEVAISKLRVAWHWVREPMTFVRNPELREDWLQPYAGAIQTANTQFEKYVAIWAIMHFVFCQHFADR